MQFIKCLKRFKDLIQNTAGVRSKISGMRASMCSLFMFGMLSPGAWLNPEKASSRLKPTFLAPSGHSRYSPRQLTYLKAFLNWFLMAIMKWFGLKRWGYRMSSAVIFDWRATKNLFYRLA